MTVPFDELQAITERVEDAVELWAHYEDHLGAQNQSIVVRGRHERALDDVE